MAYSCNKIEVFNCDNAYKLLKNWDNIFDENSIYAQWHDLQLEKEKLSNYLRNFKYNNGIGIRKVSYHYCSAGEKHSRQMVSGVGLQNLMRPVRQTLAYEYYYDVDMVNSQSTILLNYFSKKGYDCIPIQYYVENRETCLHQLMDHMKISRDDAKVIVIALLNGGVLKSPLNEISWCRELYTNINNIRQAMLRDPMYAKQIVQIRSKKTYNIMGTLLANITFDIENNLLNECQAYLAFNDIPTDSIVLVFDGFMIKKELIPNPSQFVTDITRWVKENTQYNVSYVIKNMNERIDLSEFN